jgi:CSLREA domain-containing protein
VNSRHVWTLVALAALTLADAAPGATFAVTRTADTADGACNADCSLREAVLAANATPGLDTITLPSGTYTLTRPGADEDAGLTGDLDLSDQLSIDAPAGATISALDLGDRVVEVLPGANAIVSGVTVRDGSTPRFTRGGGGIRNAGRLDLRRSVVTENTAGSFDAGGIANAPGATLTLTDVAVTFNRGWDGGGIDNDGGVATLTNVTVSDNELVEGSAQGISSGSEEDDDGNIAFRGRLTLVNVTLAHPDVALFVAADSDASAVNTIVNGPCWLPGTLVSLGHNLASDGSCGLGAPVDPVLADLADNGGSTETRALLPGSPAIDAGDASACPAADQRGVVRPQGAGCDIGAFELQQAPAGNTPLGTNVVVALGPVTVTFANVTAAGDTTVTSSSSGPPPPVGFEVLGTYYELSTTAQWDSAEVCFTYAAPPPPSIVHWVSGRPVAVATTRDTGQAVCGVVTSFSPFALVRPVSDREPPVLSLPPSPILNATSPAGAVVTYAASATDAVDPSPGVVCEPVSGSTFRIGATAVACTATDASGNSATGSFTVTVKGAREQLTDLIGKVVDASQLSPAAKNLLIGKLNTLLASFDPGNPTQRQAACLALQVFKTAVQLQAGKTIPAGKAAEWIADANRIRAVLGC